MSLKPLTARRAWTRRTESIQRELGNPIDWRHSDTLRRMLADLQAVLG